MSLYDELEFKVKNGETTWKAIITEIIKIKCESKLEEINYLDYNSLMAVEVEPEGTYEDFSVERKEMYEKLSESAKSVVVWLGELLDPIAVRGKIKKLIKERFGWSRREVERVVRELKNYANQLSYY